ncbi:hypothetical protein [uncultured Massilia sp.]|uniref:hypothetical protein n=1 Tax=uncultured Massilia sp. TaxID=169973 RepID=UPI0025FB1DC4|nr:hypothetical protein [uncultured Massilia sp.]
MHAKRLTLIGIAAIAAGYAFLSNAGPAVDLPRLKVAAEGATPACGLGPAPDAPDAPDAPRARARTAQDAGRTGYLRVCPADLDRFDVSAGLRPLPLVLASLDFTPVSLADTPMATLTSLGGMAGTGGNAWTRLYRSFRLPDGRTLTLFEHDLSADDGQRAAGQSTAQGTAYGTAYSTAYSTAHGATHGATHSALQGARQGPGPDAADEPERVNGRPAHLVVLQDDGGKAVSMLRWREGYRAYELWVDADVVRDGSRERLLAFAAALPASVPARPARPEGADAGLAGTHAPDGLPALASGIRTSAR